MGDGKSGSRRRAVGTRDRVMSHLVTAGEIRDPSGMASTVLAVAVGYPGSSVAFAQLLSGMERAGLIEREIRGKRTYRIGAAPAAGRKLAAQQAGRERAPGRSAAGHAVPARRGGRGQAAAGLVMPAGTGELDYDELARRLLIQVVQRLTGAPAGPAGAEPGEHDAALQQTVASLEQKLASVESRQQRLTAENAQLRAQLREAQESLAQAQERAGASQLDTAEVLLLERLLSPLREQHGNQEAGAS
ncbi:MAG: hypothetical protein ACM32E_17500 [Gemmatimonadota bacterium]